MALPSIQEVGMKDHTKKFDADIKGLVNKERQEAYGHPLYHFQRTAAMKAQLSTCRDPELRHALEMIADKMARLCETPTHYDSWLDIAGYARTAMMVMDERELNLEIKNTSSVSVPAGDLTL